jgi:hypothetical protein
MNSISTPSVALYVINEDPVPEDHETRIETLRELSALDLALVGGGAFGDVSFV